MPFPTAGELPGLTAKVETIERQIWWGERHHLLFYNNAILKSSIVDTGSPTTLIRAGMILGKKTSDKLLYPWNPDATDGTQKYAGVLQESTSMLDSNGVAVNKNAPVIRRGPFKVAELLIEGTAFLSSGDEHLARRQMALAGVEFDDEVIPSSMALGGPSHFLNVAGATTLTSADNGAMVIATGADVAVTLPAIESGLVWDILMAADQELVIASAEGDNVVVGHDLSADSITFTTAGQQIGARIRVESIYVGTTKKWLARNEIAPFGTGVTGGFTLALGT